MTPLLSPPLPSPGVPGEGVKASHHDRGAYNGGMSDLFSSLTIREVTLRNRVGVSPMCQYSCEGMDLQRIGIWCIWDREQWEWAGLVIAEATAVECYGRIFAE